MSASLTASLADAPMSASADTDPMRFVVHNAQEAVEAVRTRLGPQARVLSVRSLPADGLGRWFGRPRLEVIATATPASVAAPTPAVGAGVPAIPTAATPRAESRATLRELLRRAGVPERVLARLTSLDSDDATDPRPLHLALAEAMREVRAIATARPARPLPARTAFIGPAGAGRTTALGKWLGREVIGSDRCGAVWRVEIDEPNPTPALDVLAEALGVPVWLCGTTPETGGAPATGGDFLYADLPPLRLDDPRANATLRRFLDAEQFTGRVLVLNAAYDLETLQAAYAAGRAVGATHLVFTHLDEVRRWGRLWEFLCEGELTPLFLSRGAGLSGDLDEAPVEAFLRRTFNGT